MKKIFILIFLSGFIYCSAQTDTTVVPFVSYWSKGDIYNFKITKIRKQWKGEELTKSDSASYDAKFEVLDYSEKKYKIKWTYNTNFSELNIPQKLIDKLTKYRITDVIYETSDVGEILEILNWKDISKIMNEMFEEIINLITDDKTIDKETFSKSIKPLQNIITTKEGIEQLSFKELRLFHFPFGLEYSINKPVIYEDQLPNVFGGKPIRGDVKIYFEKVDFDEMYCKFVQEMTLNPDDTKEMVLNILKRMTTNEMELEKAIAKAKYDIKDYNVYEYYFNPGIPIKIETKREVLFDLDKENGKRIDILKIELVEKK